MALDASAQGAAPAVLLAALGYLGRGWRVLPVERRGKKPFNPDKAGGGGWQFLRADEQDIRRWFGVTDLNVGVILGGPSGALVDIDLDASEAVHLARRFLPKTEAKFGRASKPNSHWLYVCHKVSTQQFKDPSDGATLVELRAGGAQTVFPPSLHASGELVEWASLGDPLEITREHLARAVGELAAASLLARHWPKPGGRHDACLTLTGFLNRAEWSDEHIAGFVAAISNAAGGAEDFPKRLATARDASARKKNDRPLRGFPALAELVGEPVARKVAEWLGVGVTATAGDNGEGTPTLVHGSHVAMAAAVLASLRKAHGGVVFCEGAFWVYGGNCWRALADGEVRRAIHDLDGASVQGASRRVSLTKASIDGVSHELMVLAASEGHFQGGSAGINCASGLVLIDAAGRVNQASHDPEHRRRHVIRGAWSPQTPITPLADSLFAHFLRGCFGEDAEGQELVALLAEAAGIAALGWATQLREPAAIILHGPSAANGKSQMLELMRGLVSPEACAALSPAQFSDEKRLVLLAGKTLNACDELGGAAIFSDGFKRVISGEPTGARDLYKSAFEFRPIALHVFAANELPKFQHGFDRGVRRRVIVVPMNRAIPQAEQVPLIARRILQQESDLVLAWAVAGAQRVRARRWLVRPSACAAALESWAAESDVVLSWLHDESEIGLESGAWASTRELYLAFRMWAAPRGFLQLPDINVFSRRVLASGIEGVRKHRVSKGAGIAGLKRKRQRDQR